MPPLNLHLIAAGLIALGFWLPGAAIAQEVGRSFDISMDPRTIALGEGGAALLGSTDPFVVNPAALALRSGIWLEYTRRGMEWLESQGLEDMRYRSWSAGAGTRVGTFAFTYRRHDYGEFPVSTISQPEGVGSMKIFDHTFGVGWAYALASWLEAGAAAKAFTIVQSVTSGPISSAETTPAYLLDIGFLAKSGPLLVSGRASDNLSVGIALQNFGSNFRMRQPVVDPNTYGQRVYEYSEQLPRTFRLGVSYQISVSAEDAEKWVPLRAAVTGDYWNVLNTHASFNEHYVGYGIELMAYELLSVRLGGYIQPFQSVYGRENVAMMRYGVGLDLPFRRFAPRAMPLTFSASYTAIPLYNPIYFFTGGPGTANVFSLTLTYQ